MFKIDFLKGQGLPARSRRVEIGLFAGIAAVSALILCLLFMQYFHNSLVLRAKQKYSASLESRLKEAAGKGSIKSRIKKNLGIYHECYFEIASSIGRYVQWTPLLRELANSLPQSMLINELSVTRSISKEKVTSIRDTGKQVDFEIVKRTLNSDLLGFNTDENDTAVKSYLAIWRDSEVLSSAFEKVYLAESSDAEYKESTGRIHKVKNHIIRGQLKSQKIADKKL
jgi:uncharacterized protein (DUF2344 family)